MFARKLLLLTCVLSLGTLPSARSPFTPPAPQRQNVKLPPEVSQAIKDADQRFLTHLGPLEEDVLSFQVSPCGIIHPDVAPTPPPPPSPSSTFVTTDAHWVSPVDIVLGPVTVGAGVTNLIIESLGGSVELNGLIVLTDHRTNLIVRAPGVIFVRGGVQGVTPAGVVPVTGTTTTTAPNVGVLERGNHGENGGLIGFDASSIFVEADIFGQSGGHATNFVLATDAGGPLALTVAASGNGGAGGNVYFCYDDCLVLNDAVQVRAGDGGRPSGHVEALASNSPGGTALAYYTRGGRGGNVAFDAKSPFVSVARIELGGPNAAFIAGTGGEPPGQSGFLTGLLARAVNNSPDGNAVAKRYPSVSTDKRAAAGGEIQFFGKTAVSDTTFTQLGPANVKDAFRPGLGAEGFHAQAIGGDGADDLDGHDSGYAVALGQDGGDPGNLANGMALDIPYEVFFPVQLFTLKKTIQDARPTLAGPGGDAEASNGGGGDGTPPSGMGGAQNWKYCRGGRAGNTGPIPPRDYGEFMPAVPPTGSTGGLAVPNLPLVCLGMHPL